MTKNKNTFWRLVAMYCTIAVILAFTACYFFLPKEVIKVYQILLIPISLFLIFCVYHQMRFPLDLRIYVIWVFLFSFLTIAYGFSALSLFCFYCGYILGMEIRYLRKGTKWKLTLASVLYAASALYQLRLSPREILDCAGEFVMMLQAILLMHFILKHLLEKINKDIFMDIQKEDLFSYFNGMDFSERDRVMLEEVLNGCKYEEIAINHKLSLSSVKKRLAFLYKKLGVTCQIDFLIKFANNNNNSDANE